MQVPSRCRHYCKKTYIELEEYVRVSRYHNDGIAVARKQGKRKNYAISTETTMSPNHTMLVWETSRYAICVGDKQICNMCGATRAMSVQIGDLPGNERYVRISRYNNTGSTVTREQGKEDIYNMCRDYYVTKPHY